MGLGAPPDCGSWNEVALRFTAHRPGVASSIVGTRSLAHFKQNLAWVEKGPLPEEAVERLRAAFLRHDQGWPGLI
jgi:aryl-alcohol dehydrogenase-like predicted oxidoreductase